MSTKEIAFRTASEILKAGIRFLGQRRGALVSARLAEELSAIIKVKTGKGTIHFYCPGEIPLWRAQTLLIKEPETIEWINTFEKGDVFWDIGANIGIYSLYAALRPDLKVLSFEPAGVNYYVLNRNIEINRMPNKISSFCIAFNDVTRLDYLHMVNTEIGGALHAFAEPVDWHGKPFTAKFKQAMLGFSIDDFMEQFDPPFPNHIKIDVDGFENKIIDGAEKTIFDKRLKSILVELDTDRVEYCENVIASLENAGMKLYAKKHADIIDESEFSMVYNHIFRRV
ncbi:MAG: FkbM family methyltransferase [Deltaproteobacteria bacterium]|nr:FkbM family methyltransferase [Deltaproteobacteria bacterium]